MRSRPSQRSALACWSARAAELPFAWIAADSVYGGERAIRRWAEDHRVGYVLTITSGRRLAMRPVSEWFADQVDARPGNAPLLWQRLSAGDGAKGPRLYDWALVPIAGPRKASSARFWSVVH